MKIQCDVCNIKFIDNGTGICPNCGHVNTDQKPKLFKAKLRLVREKKEMIHKEYTFAHTLEQACEKIRTDVERQFKGFRIEEMDVYEDKWE